MLVIGIPTPTYRWSLFWVLSFLSTSTTHVPLNIIVLADFEQSHMLYILLHVVIMFVRSILAVVCDCCSSIFIALWYSILWICQNIFTHSTIENIWVVPSWELLRIVLLWIFLYVFLGGCVHEFFGVCAWEWNCWIMKYVCL